MCVSKCPSRSKPIDRKGIYFSIASSTQIIERSPDSWLTESDQANNNDLEKSRPVKRRKASKRDHDVSGKETKPTKPTTCL
jgi:hypothetical protein